VVWGGVGWSRDWTRDNGLKQGVAERTAPSPPTAGEPPTAKAAHLPDQHRGQRKHQGRRGPRRCALGADGPFCAPRHAPQRGDEVGGLAVGLRARALVCGWGGFSVHCRCDGPTASPQPAEQARAAVMRTRGGRSHGCRGCCAIDHLADFAGHRVGQLAGEARHESDLEQPVVPREQRQRRARHPRRAGAPDAALLRFRGWGFGFGMVMGFARA